MPDVSYELLKDACAEATLTIYQGPWPEAQLAQIAQFHKRFPCITVRRFELQGVLLRERFLAEFRANNNIADIVQDTDPGNLNEDADQGFLMNYKVGDDRFYPDGLKKAAYWYPLKITFVGNAWNTDLVSDAEAKSLGLWTGMADPAWKGRAGVTDVGGIAMVPWYLVIKTYGVDFLAKVGALKPRVFSGNGPAAGSLASGDVSVLLGTTETGVEPVWAKGAPIHWALPEPGGGAATGQGISAHAPHPNAAKLYQDYAFTEEGYAAWQTLGGAPARSGYKDRRKVAAEPWYKLPQKMFVFDPADEARATPATLDAFHRAIGKAR